MAIVALHFQRVQLNGMLLKSYRNQHVKTAKCNQIRIHNVCPAKDASQYPIVTELIIKEMKIQYVRRE